MKAKRAHTVPRDAGSYTDWVNAGCYVRCPSCQSRAFAESSYRVTCSACGFSMRTGEARIKWFGPMRAEVGGTCSHCSERVGWRRSFPSLANPGQPLNLRCPNCRQQSQFEVISWFPVIFTKKAEAVDPMFGLPLWYQIECCGHVLWAFNHKHIQFLREYVGADLRIPGPAAHRLPTWLLRKFNRPAILRALKLFDGK
jgi:hypothetical protein